jgi:hypothetical protein
MVKETKKKTIIKKPKYYKNFKKEENDPTKKRKILKSNSINKPILISSPIKIVKTISPLNDSSIGHITKIKENSPLNDSPFISTRRISKINENKKKYKDLAKQIENIKKNLDCIKNSLLYD